MTGGWNVPTLLSKSVLFVFVKQTYSLLLVECKRIRRQPPPSSSSCFRRRYCSFIVHNNNNNSNNNNNNNNNNNKKSTTTVRNKSLSLSGLSLSSSLDGQQQHSSSNTNSTIDNSNNYLKQATIISSNEAMVSNQVFSILQNLIINLDKIEIIHGTVLIDCINILDQFLIDKKNKDCNNQQASHPIIVQVQRQIKDEETNDIEQLAFRAVRVAQYFRDLAGRSIRKNSSSSSGSNSNEGSNGKLNIRKQLKEASSKIMFHPNDEKEQIPTISHIIAYTSVILALSFVSSDDDDHRNCSRAAASAMTSTFENIWGTKFNNPMEQQTEEIIVNGRKLANFVLQAVLQFAVDKKSFVHLNNQRTFQPEQFTTRDNAADRNEPNEIDLHIITAIARSFQLDGSSACDKTLQLASQVIRQSLNLQKNVNDDNNNTNGDDDDDHVNIKEVITNPEKIHVAACISLAAQLYPWKYVIPVSIINCAILCNLWHGAESVAASTMKQQQEQQWVVNETMKAQSIEGVHTLIDASIDAKFYRNADTYATKFFHFGGNSRFLEARFLHACDTIAKCIRKRAFNVIEVQVRRIDESIMQVVEYSKNYYNDDDDDDDKNKNNNVNKLILELDRDYLEEIRDFSIRKLEENGDIEAARRLAEIWGISYVYSEEKIFVAAAARKKKYLQWEDFIAGDVPDLVSTSEALYEAFTKLGFHCHVDDETDSSNDNQPISVYGFDVEWSDNNPGASLLQISTTKVACLIDIPALSRTNEGSDALERTVGRLFASQKHVVAGFSCRQDVSRLRNSFSPRTSHWLFDTYAVRDVQISICKDESKLKECGLSRCCEYYIGKPLDKSEQCSVWDDRPLSREQRAYAALDAFVCAFIYEKLHSNSSM